MMLLLSAIALMIPLQEASSQSLRSIVKKKIIEDNLEAQAKRDSIRAVEEGREPDQSPNTTMTHVYMDALGLSDNVEYESSYPFNAYLQMQVSEYNDKGKMTGETLYDSYIKKDRIDYAMVYNDQDVRTTVVFDSENSVMLILSADDDARTGFAMEIDPETLEAQAEEYAEESEIHPANARKTGKKKEILGYTCEEYLIDEEHLEARIWVSEELGKDIHKQMLRNNQVFGTSFYHAGYFNGMVLEYDYTDKEDGDRWVMQVTDIDLNRDHSISTREYAVLTMRNSDQEEEGEEDPEEE